MGSTRFTLAILSVVSLCVHAAPIVNNADFTQRLRDDVGLPAVWTVPKGSPWHSTNDDGHSGHDSLRYRVRVARSASPVTQAISLPPKTDCMLHAWLKSDGAMKPLVRVRTAGGREAELARVHAGAKAGLWTRYTAKFNSGETTAAVVEIWADAQHCQGRKSPGGTVVVDDVQIVVGTDEEAFQTNGAAVAYENLARGKPYTLQPKPDYRYCTDPGDGTQLTDGQYTAGHFWTQKTTVGWVHPQSVIITLDLGGHHPIRGVSFNTAGGRAGVAWPASIRILVSIDGRSFHSLGDLIELSQHKPPTREGYAVHRFRTDDLKSHGQYLKLIITPTGPFCLVDEIEVFRGADEWKSLALPGEAVREPLEYFDVTPLDAAVRRRIERDLLAARAAAEKAGLPGDVRQRIRKETSNIERAIAELPPVAEKTFRTVHPMNALHARVYAIYGVIREAQGCAPLVAWATNPWDPLTPVEMPGRRQPGAISVAAMKGETRAAALNVANCTQHALTATVVFEGLPGGSTPSYVAVHEVAWTDTRQAKTIAAALPQVTPDRDGLPISLPAGMTRQVWFSFTPRRLQAGTHSGFVVVTGAGAQPLRVPIVLHVFDTEFPKQPRLHLGGWDYTDGERQYRGVTPQNRAALIAHLQERYVDSTWATPAVMPYGEFDDAGGLVQEPETARFDTWVERWPNARRYQVHMAVRDHIAGTKMTEPLFSKKVGAWITFWAAHARKRGIEPSQLYLLLVDEPQSPEQDRIIIAWAQAIKTAAPGVVIWEDPVHADPRTAAPKLMASIDVLCLNRSRMLGAWRDHATPFGEQRQAGRRLDLYSCSGPVRLLDPYAYHRLQAWSCFNAGAEGTFFWAFGSTGGGDSWNEYASQSMCYTPLFLGVDSATPGKHMEAIRESVADFEYLAMLRDRVAWLEKRQPAHEFLPEAKVLLANAADRVLSAEGATEMQWQTEKDRSVADRVRVEIGTLLEKLK